jgi:hypothetical protein
MQKPEPHHRPLHPTPAVSLKSAGTHIEADMAEYDPAPTGDEEIEQAYQEKYG